MKTYTDKKGRVWAVKDEKGRVRAVKCRCNRSLRGWVEDGDRGETFLSRGGDDFCDVCNTFFYYTTRRVKP